MKKVGLLVCGNSGIDYEEVGYPYEILRSKLIIEGEEFEDYIDITAEDFYDKLNENPDLQISTAMVSPGEVMEKLEALKAQGYTEAIAIVISSKLSGTFQTVKLTALEVEGIETHVVDSLSVTFGQLKQILEAIRLIKEGKSALEIYNYLEEYKKRIKVYVLVDTLKYLVKNGRLSVVSGMLGGLLKIKPILNINEEGSLVPFQKVRTSSKARQKLIEIAKDLIDKGTTEELFLAYTDNKEFVEDLRNELLEYAPNFTISIHPLTPVVGAHAGPGTCGFGVVVKE